VPTGSVESVSGIATGVIVSVRWSGSVFRVIQLDRNFLSSRAATSGKGVFLEGTILTHNDYLI